MTFLAEAIEKLAATPARAAELTRGFSAAQLSRKPNPELFSLRENILHLRDIDIEGYENRIHRILRESSPILADVNGAKLAAERDYNAQPIEPALADLARSRGTSIALLRECTEADLLRTAEMQGSGVVTLQRLLEMWMRHDADHLADMAELRLTLETGDSSAFVGKHEAA